LPFYKSFEYTILTEYGFKISDCHHRVHEDVLTIGGITTAFITVRCIRPTSRPI